MKNEKHLLDKRTLVNGKASSLNLDSYIEILDKESIKKLITDSIVFTANGLNSFEILLNTIKEADPIINFIYDTNNVLVTIRYDWNSYTTFLNLEYDNSGTLIQLNLSGHTGTITHTEKNLNYDSNNNLINITYS